MARVWTYDIAKDCSQVETIRLGVEMGRAAQAMHRSIRVELTEKGFRIVVETKETDDFETVEAIMTTAVDYALSQMPR